MQGLSPAFLVLKPRTADALLFDRWTRAIEAARGTVLAAALPADVEPLEAGTVHTAFLLARFAFSPDLDSFWAAATDLADALPPGSQALGAAGLPFEGWPGSPVPTIASVSIPASNDPRAYMLIEGTGTDEARMDAYRDIILPMLRARGAYYPLFELGGAVRVLHGTWSYGILAVSRWPDTARAHDFWFSDRYQNTAIPTRTGAGMFEVQLAAGLAG
ncbi:MAG: DUF1330 domain-containing protein [Sandaracinobacteroides sp.]